jgi:sugar transferase (PEP-CTERM/EpsH1 system associated)
MSRVARPIRVCHVLLSLRPGGLENGVVNVINGIDREEFVSSVCCLQTKGQFAERITDSRCTVREFGLQKGNDPKLPFRLARAFKELGVDVVHTRNAESFFYGYVASRLAGLPIIHSEHGRTFPEKWHRAFVQRVMLRKVDRAFAVTRELAQAMVTNIGVKPGRFEVVYNGVDSTRFKARDSVPGGDFVIGSVGRLVAVKNYPLLLNAVAKLPGSLPWKLRLVGDGPERERLAALARELKIADRVELPGHSEDVPGQLRQMSVFVLPSISEGMSNTLLEAMAAGVPVIASDVGGNGEIIEDQQSGFLFPSGDVDRASQLISQVLTDTSLRERLATAGVARVHSTFTMAAMMERYQNLYRDVWRKTRGQSTAPVFVQARR